jgi:hypothetical protein
MQLLLECVEVAHRLLEAVVLEQDRGLGSERFEQPQGIVPEHRRGTFTVADEQQSEHPVLPLQRKRDRPAQSE